MISNGKNTKIKRLNKEYEIGRIQNLYATEMMKKRLIEKTKPWNHLFITILAK